MPADLLDRLQRGKLQAIEEFIDSHSGIAENDENDKSAASADFVLDEGIGLHEDLVRFWDYHWTAALSGKVEERENEGMAIRSFLERGATSLARIADVARAGADLSGHDVARLIQFEELIRTFPLWIEECMAQWAMLDRPRKPLDRDRIARARAAFERGECEPVSDIIVRVEKGGSLAME